MGFRYDTRHLTGQQQAIIRQRDKENELLKNNKASVAKTIYPLKIFMKLGTDSASQHNGTETFTIYKNFSEQNGGVWFSTDALATGMAEIKKIEFLKAISEGQTVEMYFAVSKMSDGENKMIGYAEVMDIKTDSNGIGTPDRKLTPHEWIKDINKIWIKIINIEYCNEVNCNDFKIATTGNRLLDVISTSQYHFGYIIKK